MQEQNGLDSRLTEKFLSREEIYPGKIIRVEKWQVELPNGGTAMREIVKHNGASAIVPVDGAGMVTLVRQHRAAIEKCTWEIPAGKLDTPAEDPFDAAKRELEEETGLQAQHWQLLTAMYTTPGFCNEKISIYLATGLSQHPAHPDTDEFLRLKKIPLDDAVAQCVSGEIQDGKTLVGLLLARQALSVRDMPLMGAGASVTRFSGPRPTCEPK
ncbi:MAG: NUDIX hydrolase [Clostridia bacterium]|nr:NUDIX hydrolase [Clostridia bacterium]